MPGLRCRRLVLASSGSRCCLVLQCGHGCPGQRELHGGCHRRARDPRAPFSILVVDPAA